MNFIIIFIITMLNADISPGYTLYSPFPNQAPSDGYNTYLIDNNENIINQWNHDCRPVSIAYLLPDSSIIIPCTQNQVEGLGENEIPTSTIGKFVMDGLANLDQVAYVRFASVYRNFKEAKDFEQFIGNLNVYKKE